MSQSGSDTQAFHNRTYGPNFKYAQFLDSFTAELFNATEWAALFKEAGARYVVPTSKHHEGFTLWPSAQSWNWNAVDAGPKRDLVGEMMDANRKAGLYAGFYFSLYEWYNPLYVSDTRKYIDQIMTPQWYDLINTYKPDILWCDGEWMINSTYWGSPEFVAWLFNDSPVKDTIAINDRFGSETRGAHGGYYTAEYSTDFWLNHKWEENSGIDTNSYGYNRNTPSNKYYSADYLIRLLVRSVANGGNLLLDIGPAHDGSIPLIFQERLRQMGAWLNVNGEGIYYTRMWRVQQEGSVDNTTIRYTYLPSTTAVYAFLLDWPSSFQITVPSPITTSNTKISMLGVDETIVWTPLDGPSGFLLQLPQVGQLLFPNPEINVWVLKMENVL